MAEAAIIHQSSLIGRRVLNRNTADDMGLIQEIWVDPRHHQVLGFGAGAGPLGIKRRIFLWSQIESMGDGAVVVSTLNGIEREKPAFAEQVLGREVWTDEGNRVGRLLDYRIHRETGDVQDYLFSSDSWGGLAHGVYALPPTAVISMNAQRLLAATTAIAQADLYTGNLSQQARSFLQGELEQTRQDLSSVVQGAQAIAQQLKQTTQNLASKGKTQITSATQQVQEKAGSLTEQTKEKLTDVAEQWQGPQEQLQKTTAQLAEQAREKISGALEQVRGSTAKRSDPHAAASAPPEAPRDDDSFDIRDDE